MQPEKKDETLFNSLPLKKFDDLGYLHLKKKMFKIRMNHILSVYFAQDSAKCARRTCVTTTEHASNSGTHIRATVT